MRILLAVALLCASTFAQAQGTGKPAFAAPEGFELNDSEFDQVAQIKGPLQEREGYTFRLLTSVEKRSGRVIDLINVEVLHKGSAPARFNEAATDSAAPLNLRSKGERLWIECLPGEACTFREFAVADLSPTIVTANRKDPVRIRFRGPGGAMVVTLDVPTIHAHLQAVNAYRRAIGK